jgi:hypothetical protein
MARKKARQVWGRRRGEGFNLAVGALQYPGDPNAPASHSGSLGGRKRDDLGGLCRDAEPTDTG